MTDARNITIHIERLVLDGITLLHAQRPLLQAAVEAELGRLLAEGGLAGSLQNSMQVSALRSPAIQITQQAEPAVLGSQIARSVYSSLGATPNGNLSTGADIR